VGQNWLQFAVESDAHYRNGLCIYDTAVVLTSEYKPSSCG
jgi:hypothetical protein